MSKYVNAEDIGLFIRELRKERGYTQKELGEKIKISDKAISKWERGLSFPDITLLPILSEILEVTVGEIMNGKRNESKTVTAEVVEEVVNKAMEYSKKSYGLKGKKVAILIIMAVMAVSGMICLIVNIAANHTVSWSLYPIGAMLMTFFPVAAALFSRKNKLEMTAVVSFATLMLYLLLIQFLSGVGGWILTLALPIAFVAIGSVYGVVKSFFSMKNKLFAWAKTCLLFAVGPLFLIDMIVKQNGITRTQDYSNVIGIPILLATSTILYIIGRSLKKVK